MHFPSGLRHLFLLLAASLALSACQQKVILAPTDQYTDSVGNLTTTLDNAAQVETFLKRRAKEDIVAAGPGGKDKPLRSVIILRVHKETSFEKTYAIMKACRTAGYLRVQLRAIRYSGQGEV